MDAHQYNTCILTKKIELIQRVFRRFSGERGMTALFDKVYPKGVDAAHAAWFEGHKTKDGVLPLLQMLSRLCCRQIASKMPEIAEALANDNEDANDANNYHNINNNDQINLILSSTTTTLKDAQVALRKSVAQPYAQNVFLLNAHELCPNVFVDAFFISTPFFGGDDSAMMKEATYYDDKKPISKKAKNEAELKEAALALSASPIDRFHMLTSTQRETLGKSGNRLVMCYNDLLKEILRIRCNAGDGCRIEVTFDTALKYEIALAAFHDMHREHHTHPRYRCVSAVTRHRRSIDEMRRFPKRQKTAPKKEEDRGTTSSMITTTSLQSVIDIMLGEIASALQRVLKRARVIKAAKNIVTSSRKDELTRVIALQEEQLCRLTQHVFKKIKEIMRILGAEPLPMRLLEHLQHALVMALSTGTSVLKTRHAAFGIVQTIVLYGRAHNNDAFKDAGAFIYAAAVRADPDATPHALQKVAHVPVIIVDSHSVLPNLSNEEIAVDAWRVLLTSFQHGNTGAAALLIADVISVCFFWF